MKSDPASPEHMAVIDRRRIEAMVLGPMLKAFQAEFGVEKTNEIAAGVITGLAREQGAEFARGIGANGLDDYAANKEAWRRHGALEVEVLESNSERYSFNVTRCMYAEMYTELGYPDLGAIFSCTRDFEFVAGFNPGVKLERTQTIMQGASHCDFRYSMAR